MIQTVSIKAFIRDKGGWNGKTDRVYIRVLVGSRKKVYSTGVSGAKKNFDNGAGEFRARSADGQKNNKLVEIRSAMLRIVKTLELTRPDFTIHDFHAAYTAVQNKTETVLLLVCWFRSRLQYIHYTLARLRVLI